MQDNWPSVLFAMAGGVFLSLGNLSTQYAWAYVGLSVTEVITSSITVVIGVSLSFSPYTLYSCLSFYNLYMKDTNFLAFSSLFYNRHNHELLFR